MTLPLLGLPTLALLDERRQDIGMMLAAPALVILAVAGNSSAQITSSVTFTNEDAELSVQRGFQAANGLWVTPVLKAGELAPTGDFPAAASTLAPSPYAVGAVRADYSGAVESLAIGTFGFANINSRKGIADPTGSAASPASALPAQASFSQRWLTGSGYVDIGKVVSLGEKAKAAVFAAAGAFAFHPLAAASKYAVQGGGEGNIGAMAMTKIGKNDVTLTADLQGQGAMKNMWRNGEYTLVPSALGSAEVGRRMGGARAAFGVEATASRADRGVRPYAELQKARWTAILAGDLRDSKDPFFPNRRLAGLEVEGKVARGLTVSAEGYWGRESFPTAPAWRPAYDLDGKLTIEPAKFAKAVIGWRSRDGERPRGDLVRAAAALNRAVPGPDYGPIFDAAFRKASTLDEFAKLVPIRNVNDMLAALSAFTSQFSSMDYNSDEGHPPNVEGAEAIYERARKSFLTGVPDPILVCIGSSQFGAEFVTEFANRIGRNSGIAATATTVDVPDAKGRAEGHAATMVETPRYGIVFVDWGRLTPTYSPDPRQALAVYQALQGIPEISHAITEGPDGKLVGYLFSEEGKAFVRTQTYFSQAETGPLPEVFEDDPRTYELTLQHYRDVLQSAFALPK